jgi:hypothetical protein
VRVFSFTKQIRNLSAKEVIHHMALLLRRDDAGRFQCILNGCHDGDGHSHDRHHHHDQDNNLQNSDDGHMRGGGNGCGQFEVYTQAFDMNRATAVIRLHLHVVFGREHKLQEILNKYEEFFSHAENAEANGVVELKRIIFEECAADESWKMCPQCKVQYEEGSLGWDKVIFVTPETELCVDHCMPQAAEVE